MKARANQISTLIREIFTDKMVLGERLIPVADGTMAVYRVSKNAAMDRKQLKQLIEIPAFHSLGANEDHHYILYFQLHQEGSE